jgi:hypothetical protein
MTRCSNLECPIVKLYNQVCLMQALKKHFSNESNVKLTFIEPVKAIDNNYYCSQFTG